jgi:competence protein ComGC
LKWLQDFSDKVEERAKGAAAEVNVLLDEAGALELDMKTAMISFNNLTRQRFIEHASSGSKSVYCTCLWMPLV